ncbi:hypothetical protein L6164_035065 [Bauhinia variegata]|uniref:Uncharacterized protein n=1 Tax=Bauhinia variegata TaxID=167791 RepID=A0ACB9KWH2_BAUVA|nr:hypothetical protein L6164_035065 [Bauhinia variegata]
MEDSDGGNKTRKVVFVTVGITSFDSLVRAVDSQKFKQELVAKGYTHLLIQMGRGSYVSSEVRRRRLIGCRPFHFFIQHCRRSQISFPCHKPCRQEAFVLCSSTNTPSNSSRYGFKFSPYTPGDATPVVKLINKFHGFLMIDQV